ncbi:MAG TPA: DUF6541 family protein [Anaerolineales bacterium]
MHPLFNSISINSAQVWQITAGGIVLILPGLAWSIWFRRTEEDLLAHLADLIGVSIAATALVALIGFLLGWHFSSAWLLLSYSLLGFLVMLGVFLRSALRSREGGHSAPESDSGSRSRLKNAILLAGLTAILAWRFYQVRELVLPAWVDSLHHVLITRVMLETGGVPATLDPYLAVPFYYHFAFHAISAAFSFWSSLPPEQSVLVIGQVLNAAVALSVYRLGLSLWHDWRRAGLAALLVGFVSHMPAYYATWGRYTLLAGLVLLPLGMAAGIDLLEEGGAETRAYRPRRIARLVLFTAGLLLAHYFAALLLALFLLFLGAEAGMHDLRQRRKWKESGFGHHPGDQSRFLLLFLASAAGALLALPWMLRVWEFSNNYVSVETVLPADSLDTLYFPGYLSYLWRMAGPNRNYLLLALALFGLIAATISGKCRSFVGWTVALVLLCVPWGINLSPFRPDHGVIVLFLPAALWAADFLFTAGERSQAGFPRLAGLSLAAAVLSLLLWGVRDTGAILNPATVFATGADLQAMHWITENTPSQARFFINVAPWQYGTYRGVDGGWWVHPLTGRQTLLPPVMYILGEPEYLQQINKFAEQASKLEKGCSSEFQDLLQAAGLTHVYLVQEHGLLQPVQLQGCPYLSQVYQHQGVSIYQVIN